MTYLKILLSSIILAFFWQTNLAQAQTEPQPADTVAIVDYAFIPAISYNTDFGLFLGGIVRRYDYSLPTNPYRALNGLNLLISTQGLFLGSFNNDFPNFMGRNFRLTYFLTVSRFFEDNYFGIAQNDELFPTFEDDPDLYTFNSFSVQSELQIRKALKYYDNWRRLEFLFTNIFTYETPFDNDTNSLITLLPPEGSDGGTVNLLWFGMILELRDDEIRPTRGTFTKIQTGPSIKNFGSSYGLYQNWFEHRSYFTSQFPIEFTFANRVLWYNNIGDAPYWFLPTLGGQDNLRGFPDQRFINENYIVINTELRKWLGKFPFLKTDFGGAFFLDVGRSFSNDEYDDLFNDLQVTAGASGLISLFTDDFFLRTDFGFSREGTGFYIGLGFLF